MGTKRVGFIANDILEYLPDERGNVLGNAVYEGHGILTLDYSRLTPILWTLVKDLSTRVQALESPKTKTKTTTKAKK